MARAKVDPRKQIDAFLAAKKTLDGIPSWQPGNRSEEFRAVWTVLLDGVSDGATLQATAYPYEPTRRFTIGLYWADCISRLDFEPVYKKHRNPLPDVQRRGLEPIIVGPHFHAWEDNRHLMRGTRIKDLDCARPFAAKSISWSSALRWFCGETRVRMNKGQMLDFPRRERLL